MVRPTWCFVIKVNMELSFLRHFRSGPVKEILVCSLHVFSLSFQMYYTFNWTLITVYKNTSDGFPWLVWTNTITTTGWPESTFGSVTVEGYQAKLLHPGFVVLVNLLFCLHRPPISLVPLDQDEQIKRSIFQEALVELNRACCVFRCNLCLVDNKGSINLSRYVDTTENISSFIAGFVGFVWHSSR